MHDADADGDAVLVVGDTLPAAVAGETSRCLCRYGWSAEDPAAGFFAVGGGVGGAGEGVDGDLDDDGRPVGVGVGGDFVCGHFDEGVSEAHVVGHACVFGGVACGVELCVYLTLETFDEGFTCLFREFEVASYRSPSRVMTVSQVAVRMCVV